MKQCLAALSLIASLVGFAPATTAEDAIPASPPEAPPAALPRGAPPEQPPQLAPRTTAPTAEPKLDVVLIQLTAKDGLVDVRYRLDNKDWVSNQPDSTYLLDEATGEKFTVRGVAKIGNLAPERLSPEPGLLSYVIFNNRGFKLKHGSLVTVVIGGVRQEHVRVP